MSEAKKSWEKRLAGEPDSAMVEFVESLSVDRRLYKYDIVGSIAHAQMLSEQKLIGKDEYKEIRDGLIAISEEIAEGRFEFDATYEDIHMAVEAALVAKVGEVGKKLHTGRSRNDQVATDMRLWMRDEIDVLRDKVIRLQKALVKAAEKYGEDVMAGYTHLQRAQPVSVGMYLLSFVEQLERDYIRLKHCKKLVNLCPLGSGAIAGSTLNLDRKLVAKELGFSDITYNSIDAVSDRDFCVEFIFDCAMIATHLSRLAEDWIIYSSSEFGFVRIDDRYCTSSSMMPQKRNPDVVELIRGKTGTVYGALMGMLTICKGQPGGYNRDMQEDKRQVFAASDTVRGCLDIAAAVVSHTKFEVNKAAAQIEDGFLDATALAEYLVGKGVAFREAHGIVGTLVADCERDGKKLADVGLEDLKGRCGAIEEDVYESLGAGKLVDKYVTEGAAGTKQAREQIQYWKRELGER
jgi:argininosuccinate lyase